MSEERKTDVHTAHCCLKHGCKYLDDNCTVTTGKRLQEYPCEECEKEAEDDAADAAIVVLDPDEGETEREYREEPGVQLGQWYWVSDCDCPYT